MRWILPLLLVLGACSSRPTLPQLPPLDPVDADIQAEFQGTQSVEDIQAKISILAGRLAAARAQLRAKEDELQANRLRALQTTSWWIAGIALLVTLGCIAAAVFLSVARKLLMTGALAGLVVMIAALTLSYLLPYLVWVGIGGGVLGILGALWYLKKLGTFTKETVRVGTEALLRLDELDHDTAEDVKTGAILRQIGNGILTDVRRIALPLKKRLQQEREGSP